MKNKTNKHKTTTTVEHLKIIKNQNGVDFSFNFLEIDDWLLLKGTFLRLNKLNFANLNRFVPTVSKCDL